MKSANKKAPFIKISKLAWNILGSLFVIIGVIGIFVPLLPTTPFILLAAYCFNNGSERMSNWLRYNKLIGPYINNYQDKKGISVRAKMKSIFILWVTVGISIYFINNSYIRIILALVIIGVTTHLILIPTARNK